MNAGIDEVLDLVNVGLGRVVRCWYYIKGVYLEEGHKKGVRKR